MVEFGLKLEDNKVDIWSSQYIDYEKLKAVLKRAKARADHRDELLQRIPPTAAAEVLQNRQDRSASLASSHTSKSLRVVQPPPEAEAGDEQSFRSLPEATDATPLLGDPIKHANSWNNLHKTVFKVTSYLGLADDRALLLQAYDAADNEFNLFRRTYDHEARKVAHFYKGKINEISERVEVLVDSIGASGINMKKNTPYPRRSSVVSVASIVQKIESKIESIVHGTKLGTLNEEDTDAHSPVPDMDLHNCSLDDEDPKQSDEKMKKDELVKSSDSIKRAITDIYRTAKLLHNFSIMNYTGFVKIAKKFNKTFPLHKGLLNPAATQSGKQAELLASKMEKIYSKWFCEGDIREAQAQMLTKRGDGLLTDWSQLRLGYRMGMVSILALWMAWDSVWGQFHDGNVSIGGCPAFPVFRGIFGLVAWHWFWGMSVYVWTRYRINYIYLFEFDPRNVDTPVNIFNDAVDETLLFLICMLLYYKAESGRFINIIPPLWYPTFLIFYTIKCLIFPLRTRIPLWRAIKQVVMAPLTTPTFFVTYVGDVFTSMVKVFQDLLFSVCFIAYGNFLSVEVDHTTGHHSQPWIHTFWYKKIAIPLVCILPLWIRFNQCLRKYVDTGKRMPHLANAFKYALSSSVALFGAVHPLYKGVSPANDDRHAWFQIFWMGLFISSSLYSFSWDVYMDWGLGRLDYGFLGPRLMFPKRSHYYMVICADLVLRSMWVLTLIPPESGAEFQLPQYLTAVSMCLELFRRTIWSFFRLEHEHRHNTEGFRRVSVVPLHFNTNHKHKYNHDKRVGWKVLIEIVVVTLIVVASCAFSVIVAQRANERAQQLSNEVVGHARDL